MDLNFTKEQENFQIEVRSFLNDNLEAEVVEKVKMVYLSLKRTLKGGIKS